VDNIKDIVHKVIEDLALKKPQETARLQQAWEKIVTKQGAGHTHIAGLKNQQLTVYVDSSAWLYQMNLKKKKLLEGIQKEFPEIRKLFLKIGTTK
jgi:predicted nucleic acid-binding Zn ribbon protein